VRIAIITDDDVLARTVGAEISSAGHEALLAKSIGDALARQSDLIFAHCPSSGDLPALLTMLAAAAKAPEPVPVVVLLGPESLGLMHRLRAEGAADVLLAPPEAGEIRSEIEELCGRTSFLDGAERARFEEFARQKLVGQSPAFLRCLDELRLAARSNANVLLTGETGTGKEMFAQALHALGPRAGEPFVAVSCAALPGPLLEAELFGHTKGAFTGADRDRIGRFAVVGAGTLLLDEIGDLDAPLQVKLLRVIEQRVFQRIGANNNIPFLARLVSATCVDLKEGVRAGRFRRDLLGRIDQFHIAIPPLRERKGDVSLLAHHFLKKNAQGRLVELSPTTLDILEHFDFPMNVRQLENAIIFALAHSGDARMILPRHLPSDILLPSRDHPPAARSHTIRVSAALAYEQARKAAAREIDRIYLDMLLRKHGGNQTRAAEEAGIDRGTFAERLDQATAHKEGDPGA
jgi:DNA-binding NtrC family response regulator